MKNFYKNKGLTLIEVMITILILMVAIIGAMAYRYYSSLDTRKADQQLTAGRIGLLLLEGWRGAGGRIQSDPYNNFNPVDLSNADAKIQISTGSTGPAASSGFQSFGKYLAVCEGAKYFATMSYSDAEAASGLRILNVEVAWIRDYATGNYASSDRTVKLTTKVGMP